VHGVELLGLMFGDFEHLHAQNLKAVLLELLDDVADCVPAHGIGLNDGQSALKCFHFVVSRYSLVIGNC
jgi:hypothetical protein